MDRTKQIEAKKEIYINLSVEELRLQLAEVKDTVCRDLALWACEPDMSDVRSEIAWDLDDQQRALESLLKDEHGIEV